MLRSALKSSTSRGLSHHGPLPSSEGWTAPEGWDQVDPTHLSAPSSASLLSSVDTVTTGSSRTVGFAPGSSAVSFETASSGTREPGLPLGGLTEGKVVLRIYRFHSPIGMRMQYSLWVDERTEDALFYVDYSQKTSGWSCRVFRGQDTSGDLVFTAKRTNMSAKFEITRYHGGDEIRTVVSRSGMVRSKHSFKGYDGNQFAWKEQTGGWELLGYKADKAKTKVALGKYTSGTNTMKADSTASVEASDDPRLAELCFMVAFAIEDYDMSSNFMSHGGLSSDDDIDHH